MLKRMNKSVSYFFSIRCISLVKGLPFVFCLGWFIVRNFHTRENASEPSNFEITPDSSDKEFLAIIEEEMLRRKRVATEVCRQEGLGKFRRKEVKVKYPPVPNYEAYFFDSINKLMWCPIYKSASTSWLYNLCNLVGISDDQLENTDVLVITIARQYYPSLPYKDAVRVVDEKLKFFIVRHPFDRLLSAYRDKLEKVTFSTDKSHETQFYYEKFGKKIVEKYRRATSSEKENDDVSDKAIDSHFNASRIEPTFEEFVMYLVDIDLSQYADEHWVPYFIYCTPCLLEYDIIAKFETLYDDQRYIIEKANLQGKIFPKWKRKTKGGLSSSTAKEYFSTLSKDLLLKLYDKYRIDFEMFEYDIKEYLSSVR